LALSPTGAALTTDQRFRHILGQQRSTFSLLDAMDRGRWVILNLDKGRLGEQASTLGSLLLTKLKNALFARRRRQLFTLYCDEIQNLVAYDAGLDTLFSEARKFGISVVSANQFLEQYPPQMRAAIMAVGTHIFVQLSSIRNLAAAPYAECCIQLFWMRHYVANYVGVADNVEIEAPIPIHSCLPAVFGFVILLSVQ
jgi:hypothetical protein